ncbi:AzlC family ABC transporter permease [Alicyclobacillus sp. ALC3]|uniref:AzlC family ABC transporter permease n=1 Tax=Alicyclobacillus sp. ALC3 TaxID=2796143 RepID=UPI002379E44C|nr:AzlC family ABC transporter permease [Alicyclobacillus sp. ALC3]WDL95594.1 AzlC family ABC transporter permease [Alicyclobacillus sp. ALC3]
MSDEHPVQTVSAQDGLLPSVAHTSSAKKDYLQAWSDAFPLTVSVVAYGFAYGAIAHSTNHLDLARTLALSLFVFAGASQFTILALLHQGAGTLAIVTGTFLLNGRQVLYGVTLGPSLTHLRARLLALLSHGLTDESYSVMAVRTQKAQVTAAYFAGAGSAIFFPWQVSSLFGFIAGQAIGDPSRYGLDFAYIGAFLGLLAAQIKHRRHLVAAVLAAVAAVVVDHWWGTSAALFAGAFVSFAYGAVFA